MNSNNPTMPSNATYTTHSDDTKISINNSTKKQSSRMTIKTINKKHTTRIKHKKHNQLAIKTTNSSN